MIKESGGRAMPRYRIGVQHAIALPTKGVSYNIQNI